MNKVITNKIEIFFDYEKVANDFVICEFSTCQRYIKHGARILDSKMKALSLVFENGRTFFVLYNKKQFSNHLVVQMLHSDKEGKDYSVKQIEAQTMPKNLLLQLFINSISNPKSEYFSFHNVTGKLFLANSDLFKIRNKNVYQIPALQISITKDNEWKMEVVTFTSLAYKSKIRFIKTNLNDYPKYKLFNGGLSRVFDEEISEKELFIIRQYNGTKNNIEFLNFINYKNFLQSKCGMLFACKMLFDSKFGDYAKFNFVMIEDSVIEFDKQLKIERNEKIERFANENKFTIVDKIEDSLSQKFTEDCIKKIKYLFPQIKIAKTKSIVSIAQNILLIHNKVYYDGVEDAYTVDKAKCIQHITFEDFSSDVDAAVLNIIKEFYIKNDLIQKKISLVDWTVFDFNGDWKFGVKVDGEFVFLVINRYGGIDFKTIELDLFNLDEYQNYIKIYEDSNTKRTVEGIIINDKGNVMILNATDSFTLPDFEKVGKELLQEAQKLKLFKKEFIEIIEKIEGEEMSKHVEIIKACDIDVFDKPKILALIKAKGLRRKLSAILEREYGTPLKVYLRNKLKKNKLFYSCLNLHYFSDSNKFYYFVGDKDESLRAVFPRACKIREIVGDSYSAKKLLPLMMVDFVRQEQLSVIPFPFKYLREYILQKQ